MTNSNSDELSIQLHKQCPFCKQDTAAIYEKYDNEIEDFLTFYLCENCGLREKVYAKDLNTKLNNYEKYNLE